MTYIVLFAIGFVAVVVLSVLFLLLVYYTPVVFSLCRILHFYSTSFSSHLKAVPRRLFDRPFCV